jgi:hypothetical protein
VDGLCFPLEAIIDYKGFRVIASSILPISHQTIVYGSQASHFFYHSSVSACLGVCVCVVPCLSSDGLQDCGKTIHADNEILNDLIRQAAERMNLRKHLVHLSLFISLFGAK